MVTSCQNKTEQTQIVESELIEITKAQFEAEEMEIGEPGMNEFAERIHFTGTIIPDVNGQAQVSLSIPGIIKDIICKPGQTISRGSVLFEVTGNEFIETQKDFAESFSLLERLKSEYMRAKELYDENITTEKEFLLAQSSYLGENARYNGLKIKLENLGLNVTKIETGEFYSSYFIKSPIRGFVASVDAAIGQYIEPQQKIADIIDDQSYQLRLSFFEQNINKIKSGQKVVFYSSGNTTDSYEATINSVGRTIMQDSKSIEGFAEIQNTANFVNNQFVEGEVYVSSDQAMSVPESALLYLENDSYLLALEDETSEAYFFKPIKITIGRKDNNFVELLSELQGEKVLIDGIYNVQIE
jgi:cobalt-zinc-cadmium efflux system membrane fusion protein